MSLSSKSWLDERVEVFLDETQRHGLTVPRGRVAEVIVENVRSVAAAMHVTELVARRQFTDDTVRELARTSTSMFLDATPGSDPLHLLGSHAVSYGIAGHTIASLAVVAGLSVTAAGAPSPDAPLPTGPPGHQALGLLTAWALLIERASNQSTAFVAVPAALILRSVRELRAGLTHLGQGVVPHLGGDPDKLSVALTADIATLGQVLTGHRHPR